MDKNEHAAYIFEEIFLQIRWQRFVPRSAQNEKTPQMPAATPRDPVIDQYRRGLISRAEVCLYLNIEEKDLLRTLVQKGELFD